MPQLSLNTSLDELKKYKSDMDSLKSGLDSLSSHYSSSVQTITGNFNNLSFDSWKDTVSNNLQDIVKQLIDKVKVIGDDVSGGEFRHMQTVVEKLINGLQVCCELKDNLEKKKIELQNKETEWRNEPKLLYYSDGTSYTNPRKDQLASEVATLINEVNRLKSELAEALAKCNAYFNELADIRFNENSSKTYKPVPIPIDTYAPTIDPTATTSSTQPVVTTPVQQPVATTPAQQPVATTPVQQPVATTPAQQPVATTPVQQPVATTPAPINSGNLRDQGWPSSMDGYSSDINYKPSRDGDEYYFRSKKGGIYTSEHIMEDGSIMYTRDDKIKDPNYDEHIKECQKASDDAGLTGTDSEVYSKILYRTYQPYEPIVINGYKVYYDGTSFVVTNGKDSYSTVGAGEAAAYILNY